MIKQGHTLQQTSRVEINLAEIQTAQKGMEGLTSYVSDSVGKKVCMLKRKKQDEIE